jgi:hypothetical protein
VHKWEVFVMEFSQSDPWPSSGAAVTCGDKQ